MGQITAFPITTSDTATNTALTSSTIASGDLIVIIDVSQSNDEDKFTTIPKSEIDNLYATAAQIANFETSTQLNTRDNNNRNRANHTGTQLASTISDLGSAATLDTGTSANNIVQLDGSSRLPAVDGSQLTNLPGGGGGTTTFSGLTDTPANYTGLAGLGLLVNSGETALESAPIVKSDVAGITGASRVVNTVFISQANYDAIGTPDAGTHYIIV